jgi:hypothetical protein
MPDKGDEKAERKAKDESKEGKSPKTAAGKFVHAKDEDANKTQTWLLACEFE